MDGTVYWLWLLQVMGSFQLASWGLLERFETPEAIYNALKAGNTKGLSEAQAANARKIPLEQSTKLLDYCARHDMSVIPFDSDKYPTRLKGIYNPPILLFCMGDLSFIDDEVAITVVGTRRPSEYSLDVAKLICRELASVGVVIVSGFALGIDSVAHGAALSCKGRTVAVLGCGLDYDYPIQNTKLKRVIAQRGAVVSEFLPTTKPMSGYFPQRNRIMSGLSLGTLVVEANRRSGSLITADLAVQQGRDLFCIPPASVLDERYAGVIRFLRDGAIPVFSHLDILYEYYENFSHKLSSTNPYSEYAVKSDELAPLQEKERIIKPSRSKRVLSQEAQEVSEPNEPSVPLAEGLNETQIKIVKLLQQRSLLADEIAVLSTLAVEEILAELTELEIAGVVRAGSGQRYSIGR